MMVKKVGHITVLGRRMAGGEVDDSLLPNVIIEGMGSSFPDKDYFLSQQEHLRYPPYLRYLR